MSNVGRPMPNPKKAPANPTAAAYQRGQAARAAAPAGAPGGAPRYQQPRAGGPTPPIPHLDSPPPESPKTMSQMAQEQRRPPTQHSTIFGPPQTATVPGMDIRPTDLLPPEAQSDPMFQTGMGSMYAAAQPALAAKYGVLRGGQRLLPQALQRSAPTTPGGAPGPAGQPPKSLKPETVEGLKQLSDLARKGENGEMAAEQASKAGPAGNAAGIGAPPAAKEAPQLSEEEIQKRLAAMDEFDLSTLHEAMVKNLINNEEQRKIVEERLKPLDLAELIVNYTVTQKVPIIPGVFEPEFESLTGEDDLNLKKMLVEEAKTLKVDDRYLLDKYSLYGLTCAVHSINGKPLGSHRDSEGNFSEELLEAKFKKLLKMPLPMLAALGPHYFWFDQRVRKLFVATNIKNS